MRRQRTDSSAAALRRTSQHLAWIHQVLGVYSYVGHLALLKLIPLGKLMFGGYGGVNNRTRCESNKGLICIN
jgi:hypothetical protein